MPAQQRSSVGPRCRTLPTVLDALELTVSSACAVSPFVFPVSRSRIVAERAGGVYSCNIYINTLKFRPRRPPRAARARSPPDRGPKAFFGHTVYELRTQLTQHTQHARARDPNTALLLYTPLKIYRYTDSHHAARVSSGTVGTYRIYHQDVGRGVVRRWHPFRSQRALSPPHIPPAATSCPAGSPAGHAGSSEVKKVTTTFSRSRRRPGGGALPAAAAPAPSSGGAASPCGHAVQR